MPAQYLHFVLTSGVALFVVLAKGFLGNFYNPVCSSDICPEVGLESYRLKQQSENLASVPRLVQSTSLLLYRQPEEMLEVVCLFKLSGEGSVNMLAQFSFLS